ncbi:MAG TPA: ParB/RepB/Spo0J family partition protein [Chitinophagaceae bacterium]|nr:ParB/RepB/Spo0J family partition protein [Chitinophagaceae bacterium]
MSNPNNKKEALGKGIRSLLQSIDADLKTTTGTLKQDVVEKTTSVIRIPIEQIEVNPRQPRQDFDETALQELSSSIKMHGIIQPLTVSHIAPNRYRLIAGERRLRASKLAGLKELPVYIREVNDQQLLELALLENLQRQDLNAIEIGLSYKRLMDECSMTQEQVAERMGKERSTVTNYIRLLKLPPAIVVAVRNGSLSMGHARAIINVDSVDKQLYVFHKILDDGLSVRQTENLVRTLYKTGDAVKKISKATLAPAFKKIEDNLASHFNTRVKMQHHKTGHGSISFEYYSIEELNAILDKMNITVH